MELALICHGTDFDSSGRRGLTRTATYILSMWSAFSFSPVERVITTVRTKKFTTSIQFISIESILYRNFQIRKIFILSMPSARVFLFQQKKRGFEPGQPRSPLGDFAGDLAVFHRASPSQRFIRTILAQKIGEDLVTRFLPVEIPSTETDPTTSPLPISFSPEMGRKRERGRHSLQ